MSVHNTSANRKPFSWLIFFFGLAYFCQHFAQTQVALLNQPLLNYCKEVLNWGPKDVEVFLGAMIIPWTLKPIYGLISDFIPLFGYRRKSYLLILNALASLGFLALCGITDIYVMRMALLLTALGTAASDVLVDGLMVELGQKTGMTARFQSQQWLWFNVAAIITALGGGYLSQWFAPLPALRIAALITAFAPAAVVVAAWFIVKEEKSSVNIQALKVTSVNLFQACKSRTLWMVALFLAFWQFSPSFGSPLFWHQTNVLEFSQEFIGQLTAISSVSAVIGVLIYKHWLSEKYTTRRLMYISLFAGVLSTLSYLLLIDPNTTAGPKMAIAVSAFTGAANVLAFLATLTLAAQACPARVEALTFSVLMAVFNLSMRGSLIFGAYLYQDWFAEKLSPLIWVSAGFTCACFFIMPFVPNMDKVKQDEKESVDGN